LDPSTPETEAATAEWNRRLAPYRGPDTHRSARQLAVTIAGFASLWLVMFWSLEVSYALTLLLALPAAGFLARLAAARAEISPDCMVPGGTSQTSMKRRCFPMNSDNTLTTAFA
jgi:omega-6 fatty acid desaturase (delta-12 desaturase)